MASLTFPMALAGGSGTSGATDSGIFRGSYAWAARPLADLTVGDTFRASDVGVSPGTLYQWDGSAWKAWWPLRFDVANRVAGAGQTAEQHPAGWALALPAALLSAYRAIEIELIARKVGTAGAANLFIRIGTSGTYTSNTQLYTQNNLLAITTDTMRFSWRGAWRVESSTSLRGYGAMSAAGLEGSTAASNTADESAVTISDISNALNLSVGVSQGSAADITSLSVIWTLVP